MNIFFNKKKKKKKKKIQIIKKDTNTYKKYKSMHQQTQ